MALNPHETDRPATHSALKRQELPSIFSSMALDSSSALPDRFDVIIIGGSLSGAATALLLKESNPDLSILIIERSEEFTRRVGESTVEISSYFLGRVLGLTDHLNHSHLVKQGLRFWFYNEQAHCPSSCSEIGSRYNVRLPSYQIDRAQLDEFLLQKAKSAGVLVQRPAEVKSVALSDGSDQSVTFLCQNQRFDVTAPWVVDASGTARFLARKNDWIVRNLDHPISSIWTRFKNVRSWDDKAWLTQYPAYAGRCMGTRSTATNHLIGDGWWSWWIPLKGGDVSVGVVYDERLVTLSENGSPLDKMKMLLKAHPLSNMLLENAEACENDIHVRKHIPYYSKHIIGRGYALVGDASGFIDPFYSPGMDWIAFTSQNTANVISKYHRGHNIENEVVDLNARMVLSYQRWFQALYQDKYYYMGDFDLLKVGFMLDIGFYYFGIVSQPFKYGSKGFDNPPFSGPYSRLPFKLMRLYNRRLVAIAKKRKRNGTWGKHNNHHFLPFKSYQLDSMLVPRILIALIQWGLLEFREAWKPNRTK